MQIRAIWTVITSMSLALFLGACNNKYETQPETNLMPIQKQRVGDVAVVLLNKTGHLIQGPNSMVLQFHQASDDDLAHVNNVQLTASMPMAGAADMTAKIVIASPLTPGYYNVSIDFPMAGRWNLDIAFNGNQRGQFALNVK